jgi:conserved domain protein
MDIKEYIKLCCVKRNISNAELARRLEQTPQNFNQKMQRNSFQSNELEKIAEALDSELDIKFFDKKTKQPII